MGPGYEWVGGEGWKGIVIVIVIPAEQTVHEVGGQWCRAEDLVEVLRGVQAEVLGRDVA